MSDTPRLAMPLIAAGQAQKHVSHNDALMRLDALVHLSVLSRSQSAAPASPTDLSAYIVPAGGSGVFAGRADQLAIFEDGGWTFLAPRAGWQAWVADEAEHHVWTGTLWRRSQPESSLGAEVWGVNAAADATNRLSVSSQAALFSHDGDDHRLTVNKAAAGDTASLLFQTGFSGRAEIGLAGDDDLRVKVSADGASWTEALVVDRATGLVSLPASPWARGTGQDNLLINGDFQVNQRGFAGGALAAGVHGFDRWKADAGGATLSLGGFALTLTSGAILQPVEPALWGVASLASTTLTLSVEGLSGGSLSVGVGSAAGVIAAGAGRRSVTLTTAAGDSGPLTVRLAPVSGAVTFGRVKLEFGGVDTPWAARPLIDEQRLCFRYFWRIEADYYIDGFQEGGQQFRSFILLPVPMRATPTVSFGVSVQVNIQFGTQRGVTLLTPQLAVGWMAAAVSGRMAAIFTGIAFTAEL